MAGNSWQQPVAGEPSVGTFHFHYAIVLSASDVPDANWHELDISAQVPVGTKAVHVWIQATSSNGTDEFYAGDGTNRLVNTGYVQNAGQYPAGSGIIPVSATRTIQYKASNARIYGAYIFLTGYYL